MARKAQTKWGSCTWCYKSNHDAHNCSALNSAVAAHNRTAISFQKKLQGITGRLCGYCAGEKHSSTVCSKRFNDYKIRLLSQKIEADKAFDWLKEIGFGPGAMLSGMARESSWNSRNKEDKIVVIEEFKGQTLSRFINELLYGANRNWYPVTAVDTTNEVIRNIYLPFHPVYAPKPTSLKVQVIHRANDEDIESMKKVVDCYSSPVLNYSTAEEFFYTGYKFKAGRSKDPSVDDIIFKVNKKASLTP